MIIPKLILIFLAVFSLSYIICMVIVELKLRYMEHEHIEPLRNTGSVSPSAMVHAWQYRPTGKIHRGENLKQVEFLTKEEMEI